MVEQVKTGTDASEAQWIADVAPAPHVSSTTLTTRKMMLDVLIALIPVLAASGIIFQLYALRQIAICVGACVVAEVVFTAMRRRPITLGDFSAVVTGVILACNDWDFDDLTQTAPRVRPIVTLPMQSLEPAKG